MTTTVVLTVNLFHETKFNIRHSIVTILWTTQCYSVNKVARKFRELPWVFRECYDFLRNFLDFSNFPNFSQIFQVFLESCEPCNIVLLEGHVTRTRPSNRKELKKWFIPSNKIMLKTYHWVKIKHLNEHTNCYKVKKLYGILRTFQFRSWEQWITVQSQK